MKKIYAIILSVIIAVLSAVSLAGCNDNNKEQNVENKDVLIKKINSLKSGDTIGLGKTEKDEDIEWKVYKRTADTAYLVTTQPVAKMEGNKYDGTKYEETTLYQWVKNFEKTFNAKYSFFNFSFTLPDYYDMKEYRDGGYRDELLDDEQQLIGEPFWAESCPLVLITPVNDSKTDYKVDYSSDTLKTKQNVMLLMTIEGLQAEN